MPASTFNIADQQLKADVESGNHKLVALKYLAAVRLIHHILIVSDISKHHHTVGVVSYLNLFSRFQIGRINALHRSKV